MLSDVDPEWVEGDVAYDIGRRVRHIAPAETTLSRIATVEFTRFDGHAFMATDPS